MITLQFHHVHHVQSAMLRSSYILRNIRKPSSGMGKAIRNPSEILPVFFPHMLQRDLKMKSSSRNSGIKPGFKGCIFISGENLETLEATSVMLRRKKPYHFGLHLQNPLPLDSELWFLFTSLLKITINC